MKKLIFTVTLVLTVFAAVCQIKEKPGLFVNPGGHKGQIRSVIVTHDKKYIISGGFDKTIKIWDIEAGELVRELFSEIGTGSNGMIYTMALSSDDKYLAVGGWFGNNDGLSEDLGDIRVFDLATGKMAFVLKGHVNVINALAFTDDNKFLLSASAEDDLWLWDLTSKKVIREYKHTDNSLPGSFDDDVRSIAIHGNMFVTADQYGRIKQWEIEKKDTIRCDHYYEQIQADGVAVSPDGKYICAVADTFMTIYDNKLNPLVNGTQEFGYVIPAFSPDGKKIFFGATGIGGNRSCTILFLENNEWKEYGQFDDIDNSVVAVSFIDNDRVVVGGGNRDEVTILKLNGPGIKPTVVKRMVGTGDDMLAASLNNRKLAYANKWSENFGFSKFTGQFDLFQKSFEGLDPSIKWGRPELEKDNYSLKRYRIGEFINAGLYIRKNGKIVDSIPLKYWNGSEHHCFGFVNDFIVTGDCCGLLRAYNYNGVEVSKFAGHVGDINSISVSDDGTKLISASTDRTIKIWPLSEVGKGFQNDTAVSVQQFCNRVDKDGVFKRVFKQLNVTKEANSVQREDWLKVIEALKGNGYTVTSFMDKYADFFCNEILPIATVFLTDDGEWLIWNENGYFASSKKGSRFVGYHINQGKTKEAKYYPFEQFDLKYNRPDIILKDLGLASNDVINAYHIAYEKRLHRMGIEESQLSDDIHLPELSVKNKIYDEAKQKVSIAIEASDDKYLLDRINVFVNDVPVYGVNGISLKDKNSGTYKGTVEAELSPGKNKIQISVLNNKGAESLKETFTVLDKVEAKPDLYIISLGVSKYADKNFNLNFAAKDADDVANFFTKANIYGKVVVKELTDEQVTKEAILALKNDFLKQAQTKDVVMIFAAGHGVLDKNMNYYYGAYNMDFNNPQNGGIAYEELEQLLNGIKPLKKLFFMDSCHSGELDKEDYAVTTPAKTEDTESISFRAGGNVAVESKAGMDMNNASQLATDLFADLRRGTGATIISSAGGAEYAMESKSWNNGLFTFCFLSGMKEKLADRNKDGMIMLSEIEEYIHEKVAELSGGKQVPTARRENLEFDFRIW